MMKMGVAVRKNMETETILYRDRDLKIKVVCVDGVLKVSYGPLPIGITVMLSFWIAAGFLLWIVFVFVFLRVNWQVLLGQSCGGDWILFLVVELFLFCGVVGMGWWLWVVLAEVLVFSAEVHIDNRWMCCGNRLWHRKCYFSDKVKLLVEPCYSKGDWGFALRIASRGWKYKLLPGVFVGSSYHKARSEARKLAAKVQECVSYLTIEESRGWEWH